MLSVNHQPVADWVNSTHAQLQAKKGDLPAPEAAGTLEMDELFTLVGAKKSPPTS